MPVCLPFSFAAVHDRDKRKQFHTRTFPTTGVEIHVVKTKGPGSVKHLRARWATTDLVFGHASLNFASKQPSRLCTSPLPSTCSAWPHVVFVCRELGGCMQPIWHKYYEDADALLYVLSVTQTHEQWQAAGAQLRDILDHPDMQVTYFNLHVP